MKTAIKEKLVTVTLDNVFHNSSVNVRVPESWAVGRDHEHNVYERLQDAASREIANFTNGPARKRLARVNDALCGISDCCCGKFRPR